MTARVNHIKTVYEGRLFRLTEENVTLENGATVDLEIVRHPGAAAIVPILDSDTVVMIRQYRHSVGGPIWEIPAGTIDGDETPLACAKRELIEEAGFSADRWEPLGDVTPLPGYSDERIHVFLAAGLAPKPRCLDEDEMLVVERVRLRDAIQMIYDGGIQDAKTVFALIMAAHRLNQGLVGKDRIS
jgi:8-oxo-dGTP pyrophosphatase MutT (NUDIX family)